MTPYGIATTGEDWAIATLGRTGLTPSDKSYLPGGEYTVFSPMVTFQIGSRACLALHGGPFSFAKMSDRG